MQCELCCLQHSTFLYFSFLLFYSILQRQASFSCHHIERQRTGKDGKEINILWKLLPSWICVKHENFFVEEKKNILLEAIIAPCRWLYRPAQQFKNSINFEKLVKRWVPKKKIKWKIFRLIPFNKTIPKRKFKKVMSLLIPNE